jgi:outer membrane protein TolC
MTDVLRADIMIDELNTEIVLLEQKRKPMEAAFNWIVGRDGNTPVNIADSLPKIIPGAVLRWDSLIMNNPVLAVYDKQIQATEAELTVTKTMRKSMFGVGLQYMPLTQRNDSDIYIPPNSGKDMFMPMITTTIPIWRKKYNAAEEEKRLMQLMYSDMKKDMQNELFAMFEMTWYELEKAEEMIALLNLQTEKTEQIIELLIAAYSHSGQGFEEVLRLQQQFFRYQMEKVSLQKEYQLTLAMLDYLQGKN